MTVRLGELADLGEPVRHERYTKPLPSNSSDVCGKSGKFGESGPIFYCSRWDGHAGDHADISPSGLVLEVWPRRDGLTALDFEDGEELPDVSPQLADLYARFNDIGDDLRRAIDEADTELRILLEEVRKVPDSTFLQRCIQDNISTVSSMDSEAWDLGLDEEDWE